MAVKKAPLEVSTDGTITMPPERIQAERRMSAMVDWLELRWGGSKEEGVAATAINERIVAGLKSALQSARGHGPNTQVTRFTHVLMLDVAYGNYLASLKKSEEPRNAASLLQEALFGAEAFTGEETAAYYSATEVSDPRVKAHTALLRVLSLAYDASSVTPHGGTNFPEPLSQPTTGYPVWHPESFSFQPDTGLHPGSVEDKAA